MFCIPGALSRKTCGTIARRTSRVAGRKFSTAFGTRALCVGVGGRDGYGEGVGEGRGAILYAAGPGAGEEERDAGGEGIGVGRWCWGVEGGSAACADGPATPCITDMMKGEGNVPAAGV